MQFTKKNDPEYIQNALNHIGWWRVNFGLESSLQKLYQIPNFDEFSTTYKKFIDGILQPKINNTTKEIENPTISGYKEDVKFIDHLSKLSAKNIYAYGIELGYAQNPNNYSYSYAGFLVPKSFVKKIKEIAEADESVVIYITDATWEVEQRTRENYNEPNTVVRELRTVTNDSQAKYYNYIWKRFPCEIFDVKSALFQHFSAEYVSMQIRHSKLGNNIHWIINTVVNIVGEL